MGLSKIIGIQKVFKKNGSDLLRSLRSDRILYKMGTFKIIDPGNHLALMWDVEEPTFFIIKICCPVKWEIKIKYKKT